MYPIASVTELDLAFGKAGIRSIMPKYDEIPDEFKRYGSDISPWNDVASHWFFKGMKDAQWFPKEGVDEKAALRHVKSILASWDPKHEHKEAACAYLLNEWFNKVIYEGCPKAFIEKDKPIGWLKRLFRKIFKK